MYLSKSSLRNYKKNKMWNRRSIKKANTVSSLLSLSKGGERPLSKRQCKQYMTLSTQPVSGSGTFKYVAKKGFVLFKRTCARYCVVKDLASRASYINKASQNNCFGSSTPHMLVSCARVRGAFLSTFPGNP